MSAFLVDKLSSPIAVYQALKHHIVTDSLEFQQITIRIFSVVSRKQ
jgi:hypothetical protein